MDILVGGLGRAVAQPRVIDDLCGIPSRSGQRQTQRPGGGAINMAKTPMAARGDYDPEFSSGAHVQVLYVKSGDTWVALHWALGATDVWYAWEPICAEFRQLIPEACAF